MLICMRERPPQEMAWPHDHASYGEVSDGTYGDCRMISAQAAAVGFELLSQTETGNLRIGSAARWSDPCPTIHTKAGGWTITQSGRLR